ncbi:MAG: pseudouridine-5'-phosphate glycosidase [Actinomycetota bacterium]|nr:pseudouridine-5'-phosphate glycosidase [Actinomycetota bacterium]
MSEAGAMRVHAEVADALSAGRPVVALESAIIAHGLPRPDRLTVARELEAEVRSGGAVPATIAVIDGVPHVGLDDAALQQIATRDDVHKASVRDLAVVCARGATGATTVAATAHLAALAGIGVFATGGLGGVHRGARETWDESADLAWLARTQVVVVCAGVKSILDVGATLERLETASVTLLGYRSDRFAGFYLSDSGFPVPWRVESPQEVVRVIRARSLIGHGGAIVVANPLPGEQQLDVEQHDRALGRALEAAEAANVTGKEITPFLLEFLHRETGGMSLQVNVRLVRRNAHLAAQIAVAVA